jgi:two-component system chemotaxis response regulator CheB
MTQLVSGLPRELPAAIFVVLHVPPSGRSVLPAILTRAGPLPAAVAPDREPPERGHIYVAPPDHHLLLVGGEMRLSAGPRENGHRSAIDPLFRSGARTHGARTIGVVLSGNLDDGAAGARLISNRGGLVLVQDPDDALYPEMPGNTAAVTDVDACLPARELADKICEVLEDPVRDGREEDLTRPEQREEAELWEAEAALNGRPTELACPECAGPLLERDEGPLVRFACRVGHVFSPDSLMAEHGKELERALWAALRSLEERADLYRRMARRTEGRPSVQGRFGARSEAAEEHAVALREAIAKLAAFDAIEKGS